MLSGQSSRNFQKKGAWYLAETDRQGMDRISVSGDGEFRICRRKIKETKFQRQGKSGFVQANRSSPVWMQPSR